ncbi:MAG: adenosylcobinamide-GDP ribazoletransferase [Dehalococcoidia bacterium]|nr:adenosylcobinamide-GDP ribazoletransferase [Dehalococcoidia bacterium]
MGFWAAIQFLTIFPTPLRHKVTAKTSGQSLTYFPLVGLILGAVLLGLYYGLSFILPSSVVNALLIITLVILTGAHHLDGFIDTCDGVIAGKPKKERLAIMSDSKVGAFGIVGAILLLLLKYVSLSAAPILPALLLMPTLSRWVMVSIVLTFPYAKRSGMGLAFKRGATWQRLTIATAIALIVAVALLKLWGLVLMAALWLIAFGIASYFRSRLGGLTGDNYGAINEMAEVLVFLLLILIGRFQ